MDVRLLTLVVTISLLWSVTESANILMYLLVSSPSHKFALLPYINGLADRGHNVTVVSPIPASGPQKFVDLAPKGAADAVNSKLMGFNVFQGRSPGWIMGPTIYMHYFSTSTCEAFLKAPEVEEYISGKHKFDLVVIDPLTNECALPFAYLHGAPLIYFVTAGIYPWLPPVFGLPPAALFKGSILMPRLTDPDRLWHRLLTALVDQLWILHRRFRTMPMVQSSWEKRIGRPLPSLAQIESNASMLLLNSDPSVEEPFPYLPNIIQVGGIHLTKAKPLPKDLEEIVSGGKDGFVIFGLGSVAQVDLMPKSLFKSFVTAMARLPQRIIWKWESEGDEITLLPPNVYPIKWLPQNDLLAHPNCRAFVTHGGKLSLLEAINNSVPVVVIPFFADQDIHGHMVEKQGYGLHLDITEITADNFYETVKTVVETPSFREEAKRRGKLLRDQPDDPLARAIFWTEFILRNDGAAHMRPLARNFTWYQYHLVDVWLIVMSVVLVAILVLGMFLRWVLGLLFGAKGGKKKSKKE